MLGLAKPAVPSDLVAVPPLGPPLFIVPVPDRASTAVEVVSLSCAIIPVGRIREIRECLQILLLMPYGPVSGALARREIHKISNLIGGV